MRTFPWHPVAAHGMFTVAILAQGTSRADAVTQAFLNKLGMGSDPACGTFGEIADSPYSGCG
jgi:hypothetical protein